MATAPQSDREQVDLTDRPFLHDLHTPPRTPSPGTSVPAGIAHLYAALARRIAPPAEPDPATMTPPAPIEPDPDTSHRTVESEPGDGPPAVLDTSSSDPTAVPAIETSGGEAVDWAMVRAHVLELTVQDGRSRADFDVATAPAHPDTDVERAGWVQLETFLDRDITRAVLTRGEAYDWSPSRRARQLQAGFDAAYRYGRLSALLREDVENIDILGHDHVWVTLPDGRREQRDPVADSDADLEQLIADIADDRGRPFARPHGTVRLDIGGARFTALGGPQITPRPRVAIRRHRHPDITLTTLVDTGMLTGRMGEFLTASMRASRSHLVSGYAGAGKSTFLRALAAALPVDEPVVTIETERELYLDKLPHRHQLVDPLQYLPAVTAGEDRDAVFPLDTAIEYALRLNAQVILFGEILGPTEAQAAIKALQAGKGASSTIHAETPHDALQRFATALTQAGRMTDDAVAQQQLLASLDLIVQIDLHPATATTPRRRLVTEIAEVIPGDAPAGRMQRPITRPLWRYDPDSGAHHLHETPSVRLVRQLTRAGLPAGFFEDPAA